MSGVFDAPDYIDALQRRRAIPQHAAALYAAHITERAPGKVLRVLDVGCGPGRFFFGLAPHLAHFDIEYTGVDTSPAMVAAIRSASFPAHVTSRNAEVGDITAATGSFDVILMSEVIHLFEQPGAVLVTAAGLLRDGGRVAIRTTQLEDLEQRDWYDYFPACLTLDLDRHKSQQLINACLRQAGLQVRNPIRIDESTIVSGADYVRIHEERPYSTLREIGDPRFQEGMRIMRERLSERTQVVRSMVMTLTMGERG